MQTQTFVSDLHIDFRLRAPNVRRGLAFMLVLCTATRTAALGRSEFGSVVSPLASCISLSVLNGPIQREPNEPMDCCLWQFVASLTVLALVALIDVSFRTLDVAKDSIVSPAVLSSLESRRRKTHQLQIGVTIPRLPKISMHVVHN
jgi:ABC-type sulfate transport system permease subunit